VYECDKECRFSCRLKVSSVDEIGDIVPLYCMFRPDLADFKEVQE
jgi:hypothetical protein